jgi:hypothetical protein
MGRIVCLANSYKYNERCIAGIDIETGEWIRPVSKREDRAITQTVRTINGKEPQILDILEIPFGDSGPDEGCQPENRLLNDGSWMKTGRIEPKDLLEYTDNSAVILHNHLDFVPASLFSKIPRDQWKSLQLVLNLRVKFKRDQRNKWRAYIQDGERYTLGLKITDPVVLDRLERGEKISSNCILTISLATPWSPDKKTPERCYKLVAGVVEI